MALYVNVLKLLLVEELYSATAARLNYSINASEKGITIKLDGFNEKLPVSASDCELLELYRVV
jgi:nardilysin